MLAHPALPIRLRRILVAHPWAVLAVILLLTAPAAYFGLRLRIDSSGEGLVQQTDPAVRYYADVRDLFGNEEVDAIVVVADDVYRPTTLSKIRRLDERVAALPGVERVRSLASVEGLRPSRDGALVYGPVMGTMPASAEEVSALRREVAADPILRDTFVSRDGRAAMLVVTYRTVPEHEFVGSGVVDEIHAILAEESGPEALHLIGSPRLRVSAARLIRRDVLLLTPVATVAVALVLFLSFGNLRGVAVPLATVGIGVVWTIGLMGFLDVPLDIAGLLLPSLLLSIGSAYATHIVAGYSDELGRGGSRAEAVARVLGHVGPPVLVTAFTTLVGFAALLAYRIPTIRSFGGFATIGVAALFMLSLSFTPALLTVLPPPRRREAASIEWPRLRRLLGELIVFGERRRFPLLAGTAILLVAFAAGIPRIEIDTDPSRYFSAGSPEQRAVDASNAHLGGNINFLIVIEAPRSGAVTRVDALLRIEALQRAVGTIAGVSATSSIVDVIELADRALRAEGTALALPESDEAVQQLLLLVPPEATEAYLSPDASRAVIRVRASLQSSTELETALARIERLGGEILPDGFTVRATGAIPIIYGAAAELARGQVSSVALAVALIFVTLAIYFGSIPLALVAMVPNLVPIVLYFGVLGWGGIPLSLSTAFIASVALGLGVDEAIHLLSAFVARLRTHDDQQRAIREALSTVGPPVVFTTLALTLGSLAQVISGFVPIRQFGYLSALNVVASLLADLFLMPALLASVRLDSLRADRVTLPGAARANVALQPLKEEQA